MKAVGVEFANCINEVPHVDPHGLLELCRRLRKIQADVAAQKVTAGEN